MLPETELIALGIGDQLGAREHRTVSQNVRWDQSVWFAPDAGLRCCNTGGEWLHASDSQRDAIGEGHQLALTPGRAFPGAADG